MTQRNETCVPQPSESVDEELEQYLSLLKIMMENYAKLDVKPLIDHLKRVALGLHRGSATSGLDDEGVAAFQEVRVQISSLLEIVRLVQNVRKIQGKNDEDNTLDELNAQLSLTTARERYPKTAELPYDAMTIVESYHSHEGVCISCCVSKRWTSPFHTVRVHTFAE